MLRCFPGAGLLAYGAVLGTLVALQLIGGDRDVLTFPVIQRHRYFRLKHRLGPCEQRVASSSPNHGDANFTWQSQRLRCTFLSNLCISKVSRTQARDI